MLIQNIPVNLKLIQNSYNLTKREQIEMFQLTRYVYVVNSWLLRKSEFAIGINDIAQEVFHLQSTGVNIEQTRLPTITLYYLRNSV